MLGRYPSFQTPILRVGVIAFCQNRSSVMHLDLMNLALLLTTRELKTGLLQLAAV